MVRDNLCFEARGVLEPARGVFCFTRVRIAVVMKPSPPMFRGRHHDRFHVLDGACFARDDLRPERDGHVSTDSSSVTSSTSTR